MNHMMRSDCVCAWSAVAHEQLRAVDARAQAASYPELVLRADFGQYFRYGPEATGQPQPMQWSAKTKEGAYIAYMCRPSIIYAVMASMQQVIRAAREA